MLPCYLQGLVSHWLAPGASKLEQPKKTVLQPSREWREGKVQTFCTNQKETGSFLSQKRNIFLQET